jgi:hypothetical protein
LPASTARARGRSSAISHGSGDERHRRRGFKATGTIELDPRGHLVRLESEGKPWRKILFATVSVPSTFTVERRAPAAP